MSVPEALLMRSPVESDPGQFDRVAESFEDKDGNGGKDITALREVLYEYKKAHNGPDINTIALNGHRVALALRSLLRGYDNVAAAFRAAASGIRGLEDGLHDPGGFFSLQRQLRSADTRDATPMFGEPDQSFDIGSSVGEAERLAQQVKGEYARVQRAEAALLKELQEAIDEAETGELADLDNVALNGVIDEIEAVLGEDPDLAGVVEALRRSQLVLADEADGELNTDVDALSEMDHDLAVAIISGEVDVPEDEDGNPDLFELQNQIDAAMAEGKLPSEVGLDPILFPPEYREKAAAIEAEVEEFRESGLGPKKAGNPGQNQRQWDSIVDARRRHLIEERGLAAESDTDRVESTIATGDYYGDSEWKGERLGEITVESADEKGSQHPELDLSEEALDLIASEIEDSGETASAYFNELGVDHTARLPSYLSEADPSMNERFSDALGEASKQRNGSGQPTLEFTGDQIIDADVDRQELGLPAEAIFVSGDFDEQFLADAVEASVRKRDSEDGAELLEPWHEKPKEYPVRDRAQEARDNVTQRRRDELEAIYGSDATNIVLNRANENPEVVGKVFDSLGDDVELLLDPEHEFVPDDSPKGRDNLNYPITRFLGIVGEDEGRAGKLLVASNDLEEFPNPGVAEGVSLVMGQHATVMYDEEYLEEHGIRPGGRLSQSEFEALGLGKADWERLQTMVTDQGQGFGLIYGHDQLIREAIANDLEVDRRLSGDDPGYERFGLTSGVLQRNYTDGLLGYAERLDNDAEAKEKWLAAGSSGVLALTGIAIGATGIGAVAAAITSAVLAATDIGVSAFGTSPYDTGNEKRTAKELLETITENPTSDRFGDIAKEEAIKVEMERQQNRFDRGSIPEDEVSVVNIHGDRVRITDDGRFERLEHGKERSRWVPGTSRDWEFSTDNDDRVGDAENDVSGNGLTDSHTDGVNAADPKAATDQRDIAEDADVWAPLREGGE